MGVRVGSEENSVSEERRRGQCKSGTTKLEIRLGRDYSRDDIDRDRVRRKEWKRIVKQYDELNIIWIKMCSRVCLSLSFSFRFTLSLSLSISLSSTLTHIIMFMSPLPQNPSLKRLLWCNYSSSLPLSNYSSNNQRPPR